MAKSAANNGGEVTRIMVPVNTSNIDDYPLGSISCTGAFEWALEKIVRSNPSRFKILLLHVQKDTYNRVELMEGFVKQCRDIGVACEAIVKRGGDPRKDICSEVERLKPDLLVIGSRDLWFVHRMIYKSVSKYCAKNADCPVIVIKRIAPDGYEFSAQD